MRIINPSFGLSSEADALDDTPKTVNWLRDPIVLFSNSKPNAREMLEGVREQMGAYRSTDGIDFIYKDTASKGAPAEMIDMVAGKYKGALLALAD
jgi:thioredoxin reductase (NADPH)